MTTLESIVVWLRTRLEGSRVLAGLLLKVKPEKFSFSNSLLGGFNKRNRKVQLGGSIDKFFFYFQLKALDLRTMKKARSQKMKTYLCQKSLLR